MKGKLVANYIIQREVYYTLSQSKRLSIEYPEGNYNSGPAYGQKEGKIFKAVLAVAAVVAAIPSGGASLTLLSGLTLASAAISAVGIITGNKLLTEIGAVGGLVSGVIGLSAGLSSMGADIGNGLDSAGNAIPNLDGSLSAAGKGIINSADAGQNTVGGYAASANGGYGTAAQQAPNFGLSSDPTAVAPLGAGGYSGGVAPNYTIPTATSASAPVTAETNGYVPDIKDSSTIAKTEIGGTGPQALTGGTGGLGAAFSGIKDGLGSAYDKFSALTPETQKMIFGGLQQAFPSDQIKAQTASELAKAGFTNEQTMQLKQQLINSNYAGGAGGLTAAPTAIINGARTA